MSETAYLELPRNVIDGGELRHDRTGTGTLCLFAERLRFDLRDGFPLLTMKKVVLDQKFEDVELLDYRSHDPIRFEVSV